MRRVLPVLLVACAAGTVSRVRGDEPPLHERIDAMVEAATEWVAPPADDAAFARRVHLDLVGHIPTVDELRRFLEDEAAGRRERLVDRLLASPEHPRRMRELFHVMLMERRGDNEHWDRFLEASFESNRPWDEFVRAILKPDAESETDRGAAFFMTSRLVSEGAMAAVDVPGLTRDVGRLFAGVDLQCAQCHDHIDIGDYSQRDFQGLHLVFENAQPVRGDVPAVTEGLVTGRKSFSSVFTQVPMETGPVVPGGAEVAIPAFAEGEEYVVPPDRKQKIAGVPRFSPLRELANGLTVAENELFARNIANRLWFVLMGRGLVEPLDLMHAENPPSHPELLELLAAEFAAHEFDVRWFVRELVLTRTYGRASRLPDGRELPAETSHAVALEKRLSAEQLLRSALVATGEVDRLFECAVQKAGDDAAKREAAASASIDELLAGDDVAASLSKKFLAAYANPPAEPELEFEPTVAAALLVLNDEEVLRLFEPRDGNLVARLAALDDEAAVTELFHAVLSREPDESERALVTTRLAGSADRSTTLSRLAWALVASTEFLVNH